MHKHLSAFLLVLQLLCYTCGAIAEDYQQTYSLDGLLSYTMYDPGYVFIAENKRTHHYYPRSGGVIMVQCSDMPDSFSYIYSESMIYTTAIPLLVDGIEANSALYTPLSEKPFMCSGFYAYQLSFGFVRDLTDAVRDDAYFIVTPRHMFSLHYVSDDTLGACPKDNLPYTLASLVFSD